MNGSRLESVGNILEGFQIPPSYDDDYISNIGALEMTHLSISNLGQGYVKKSS